MLHRVAKRAFTLCSFANHKNPFLTLTLFHSNIRAAQLTNRLAYSFVNISTSSKYYNTQMPNLVQPCIAMVDKQQNINQKLYILQHIVQISIKNPKFIKYDLEKCMVRNLTLWKDGRGRFQRVATVAWIINKMKLNQKLKHLYDQIIDRIQNDEWYVDFDESVKAIEAYSNYYDGDKKNRVFQKIERNLNLTLSDVNMTYYQRISQSLVEAQRDASPIWNKIQHFVIRNLSMDYTPKTFFDIFKAFVVTGNGSALFYEMCQEVIYKGHLYNQTHKLRNNLGEFESTGDYFAMMVQTYALVNRQSLFPISADFLDYLYKSMLASRVEYHNISSLTKLINYMPELQFHAEEVSKVINDVINNKQFTDYHSILDIQELYFALQHKMGTVPSKLIKKVQNLVKKDMDRNLLPLPKAIELVDFLLMYKKEEQKQDSALIESLNSTIEKKFKYIGNEQSKRVIEMLSQNKRIQQKVSKQKLLPKPVTQSNDE